MKRTAALGLALATAAALWAPLGLSHSLDAGVDGSSLPSTPLLRSDSTIARNATLEAQARYESARSAAASKDDGDLPVVGAGRAGALMGKAHDRPSDARAVAATAAAGTLLGAGLIAYFWGSIKYGVLGTLMPFFSRIDSNRILDNGVRSRVHEAVLHNPGITIKEVTGVCGIGWGTAVYHLKRLESGRLIVSERHRQFRRFFKNGGGIVNEAKGAFAELKNPTAQRLATELVSHPGAAQKDLCQAIGISAPLAHKHLSRLEEAHLLTKQREWKTVKYFPSPRLAELLQTAQPVLAPA